MEEAAIVASKRALAALNSHLANNTYLVGHSVTIADIVTIANLYNPIKGLLSAKFLQDYPHVQRYFFTLVNQPNFKKVIGEVVQVAETPTDILPKDKSIFAQYFKVILAFLGPFKVLHTFPWIFGENPNKSLFSLCFLFCILFSINSS